MRCIYNKLTEKQTEFKKREHIFPAGIGGIKKLPLGTVSDEINEKFSKLEIKFMRESIMMLPRIFEGPGKRGSQSLKKRTQSKIYIMNKEKKYFLGYTEKGTPKTIFQIKIPFLKDGKLNVEISIPPELKGNKEEIKKFETKIKGSRYVRIEESKLKLEEYIVGYHKKKLYIAYNPKSNFSKFYEFLKNKFKFTDIEDIQKKLNLKDINYTNNIECKIKFNMDIDVYNRVCAKITFNALCHIMGDEFVLNPSFDELRNYILNGGDETIVQICNKGAKEVKRSLEINSKKHCVIFIDDGKELKAGLFLYGIPHLVLLTKKYNGPHIYNGFICEWENRKEFKLFEYIDFLSKNKNIYTKNPLNR